MEIVQAVVEFGSQAIQNYRGKRAFVSETTIRESSLGRFIASQMMREYCWNALTEVHYTDMLIDLADVNVFDADIMSKFGGQRADIALYQNDKPASVIEFKIVDEGRKPSGVAADRDKIQLLQRFVKSTGQGPPNGYVGVFVCDTYRGGVSKVAEETIHDLQQSLALELAQSSEKVCARTGGWGWRFFCAKIA